MNKTIAHSKPTLSKDILPEFERLIDIGIIGRGEKVQEFEKKIANRMGRVYGVAVSSGTAALHLALLILGVGKGDSVAFPSYVCSALLNAVLYTGAMPVLIDVDAETFNIDPVDLKKKITSNTKAVIVPHLFGQPANMDEIMSLGIAVIEDCAQSIGAEYKDRATGSLGKLAMCSFYATKMITTGEGGILVTDSEALYEKALDVREYDEMPDYKVRYNYKLTEMQAALGLDQVQKLNGFIERRREIAGAYSQAFADLFVKLPKTFDNSKHVFYRFVVRVEDNLEGRMMELAQRGISATRPVYYPLHRYLGLNGFAGTEQAWNSAISIPIYPSLTDEEVARIILAVRDVFA